MSARQSRFHTYRPARGEHCEIAHWDNTPDGWKAATVAGTYAGQTDKLIYLKKDGATLAFPRSQWDYVIA